MPNLETLIKGAVLSSKHLKIGGLNPDGYLVRVKFSV